MRTRTRLAIAGLAIVAAAGAATPAFADADRSDSQQSDPGCASQFDEAQRVDMESFRDYDLATWKAGHDDDAITVLASGVWFQGRDRIKQPRFPPMVWTVTELEPARSFCWVARAAGMTTLAEHYLSDGPGGSTEAVTRIGQDGRLAPLADRLLGKRGRHYVDLEAAGLKRRCEQR